MKMGSYWFFMVAAALCFGSALYIGSNHDEHHIGTEDVPCYDRHGNEIEGLVCEDKIYDEYYKMIPLIFLAGVICVFFGIFYGAV